MRLCFFFMFAIINFQKKIPLLLYHIRTYTHTVYRTENTFFGECREHYYCTFSYIIHMKRACDWWCIRSVLPAGFSLAPRRSNWIAAAVFRIVAAPVRQTLYFLRSHSFSYFSPTHLQRRRRNSSKVRCERGTRFVRLKGVPSSA